MKPGVEIVTPDPKTSGGACWNYLAAWGFALKRELGDLAKLNDPKQADAVAKAQEKAFEFVKEMYRHAKVLDSGARGSTLTFVKKRPRRRAAGLGERGDLFGQRHEEGRVRDRRSLDQHSGRAVGGRRR